MSSNENTDNTNKNLNETIKYQQVVINDLQNEICEIKKQLAQFENIDMDLLNWIKKDFPLLQSKLITVFDLLKIEESTEKILYGHSENVKKSGIVINDDVSQIVTSKSKMNIKSYFVYRYIDVTKNINVDGKMFSFKELFESIPKVKKILLRDHSDAINKTDTPEGKLKRRGNCVYNIYHKNIDNILDNVQAASLFKGYKAKFDEYEMDYKKQEQELLQNKI